MTLKKKSMGRRDFLNNCGRGGAFLLLGGTVGALGARLVRGGEVWQIDPNKCTKCGQCATHCVLDMSAVKCMHLYKMCGYCELCTGYFELDPVSLDEGAENQVCPTAAISRKYIEDPYFEYKIDTDLCIGCARCVKGCVDYGNGSLYMQVNHELCKNCNECAIAIACPADAFIRLPANNPYFDRLV